MTRPLAHDLLDRVRKALESVPLICGAPRQRYTRHTWSPDYDALAAKIAPLVEAAQRVHDDVFKNIVDTDAHFANWEALREALATWRTEGSP